MRMVAVPLGPGGDRRYRTALTDALPGEERYRAEVRPRDRAQVVIEVA